MQTAMHVYNRYAIAKLFTTHRELRGQRIIGAALWLCANMCYQGNVLQRAMQVSRRTARLVHQTAWRAFVLTGAEVRSAT